MSLTDSPIESLPLSSVLAELADIASETLELQEVFDRIAAVVRRLIPFDNMGVVRIIDGQRAVAHATTVPESERALCSGPMPLTSWSPRWRPRPGAHRRIDDGPRELDPSFPMDARVLHDGGLGSGLWEPFRRGDHFAGGVWLCSRAKHSFTDEHQEILKPIAALLGSAVEHWRIWDAERRRAERLDRTEALFATLADSLDVRDVFPKLSDGMQAILPHDFLVLTRLDVRARAIQVSAYAGDLEGPVPMQAVTLTEEEMERRPDFEIIDDVQTAFVPATDREKMVVSSGMRSWLRVPVVILGEMKGSLSFFHREAAQYGSEDAEVARRLADRIALALSFQRLAEEAQVASTERERAERLEATVERLARELETRGRGRVAGVSASWRDVLVQVGRVAPSETTALITGESGTGKEVISSLIHQGSARAEKSFVAINCAALPEQLLESELFGHEKGAFTGAVAAKAGRIEQAGGGTLFLDEIAEMSPLVQAKLLRVLEQREFQRVGGTRLLKADVRVIAATNRDLAAAIAKNAFREDLFYRLNVFQIHIPPLRERPEDILPLAETFLEELGRSMGRPAAGISRDAREWMVTYGWPGNVRELRNAIERAILLCDGGLITREHLPSVPLATMPTPQAAGDARNVVPFPSHGFKLEVMERKMVEKALGQAQGNKAKAARLLGVTRSQLYSRLEKYGIN
jgi:transcriptional regulator with GAF, ATPase, and Fis domain